jgi:hypothetical protein
MLQAPVSQWHAVSARALVLPFSSLLIFYLIICVYALIDAVHESTPDDSAALDFHSLLQFYSSPVFSVQLRCRAPIPPICRLS